MLYFDRTDVSKRIDVNEINALEEFIVCHYQYFFNIKDSDVFYGYHDIYKMSVNLNDIVF